MKHETHLTLDSTKLSTYQQCPRKCFWKFVLGWVVDDSIHNLSFGRAVHSALETLYDLHKESNTYEDAHIVRAFADFMADYRKEFAEGTDSIFHPKDPESFLLLLEQYVARFKSHDEEKRLRTIYTEISGKVPLDVEGQKHLFFRLDTVMEDRFGYHILEHKTSGWRQDLWAASWDLAIQAGMGNYVMKCLYGDESTGIIFNGLFFRKKLKRTGLQEHEFLRYPVRMSMDELQRWLDMVTHYYDSYMRDLELCYNEAENPNLKVMKAFPQNPAGCIAYNRPCEYHDYCVGCCNPLQHAGRIPEGFKSKFWDPREDDKNRATDIGEVR